MDRGHSGWGGRVRAAVRRPARPAWVLAAALLTLAACGGPTAPPKPTVDLPEPDPLTVAATFDHGRAVTTTLPRAGGTVSVTDTAGTVYTLRVPATALLEAVEVTMTPLASLSGAPVTGRAYGVLLEPSGLRLYDAAALEVVPADGEAFSAIGFAARADGSEFHLVPPALGGDAGSVTVHLSSFSEHGAFMGSEVDPIVVEESPGDFAPTDWESQLAHMLAELIAAEREAQLSGEKGDPEFERRVEAIVNTYFIEVVTPMLPRIATDCAYAEANTAQVLSWVRSTMLAGLEQTFTREAQAVSDAVRAGAHRCWEEAIEPCVDPAGPSFARVLETARMNLLLGGSEAVYDPYRDDIRCDESCGWLDEVETMDLELSFAWSQSGTDQYGATGNVARSWQAQAELAKTQHYADVRRFRASFPDDPVTASYEVDDVLSQDGGTETTSGSGAPYRVNLTVTFDVGACTYDTTFHAEVDVVTEDGGGSDDHSLTIGTVELVALKASEAGMAGDLALPHAFEAPSGASAFWTGWDGAANVLMETGLGTAAVSWSLEPVRTP